MSSTGNGFINLIDVKKTKQSTFDLSETNRNVTRVKREVRIKEMLFISRISVERKSSLSRRENPARTSMSFWPPLTV